MNLSQAVSGHTITDPIFAHHILTNILSTHGSPATCTFQVLAGAEVLLSFIINKLYLHACTKDMSPRGRVLKGKHNRYSHGANVSVMNREETVLVEFGRQSNHQNDDCYWTAERRPNWTLQMGYVGFLTADAHLQLNIQQRFVSECMFTVKIKRGTPS